MKKAIAIGCLLIAMVTGSLATTTDVVAFTPADFGTRCNPSIVGFPTWYAGLTHDDANCTLARPGDKTDPNSKADIELMTFIWTIILNVLNILFVAAGYLAGGYLMYGGVRYMTAQGSPDKIASAKKTITAAIIGLIIAIGAAVIVGTVRGALNF